jgi:mono/diheme cytochrome c family protein
MHYRKIMILVGLVVAVASWCGVNPGPRSAAAQTSSAERAAPADKGAATDELQRSAQIYYFKRIAQSGPKRGQEIYLIKCSACHNEYTIKAEYGDSAPFLLLKNLYKRPRLITGQPVNDTTVSETIRNGGAKMPSYRDTLTDRDLADLVSYLREACCWDEEKVPANPRYHPE